MKKIIEFVKKYKIWFLSSFLLIFFFKSCGKSADIKKLDRQVESMNKTIDSLNLVIDRKQEKLDSVPEIIRVEKINIHLEYDSWISSKDRGQQLMELHSVVKNRVKELQKK